MASAASASAHAASSAANLASSRSLRLSILAFASSILAVASAFICAHLLCARSAVSPAFCLASFACQIEVDLSLVDPPAELVTRLGSRALHRGQRLSSALLECFELR